LPTEYAHSINTISLFGQVFKNAKTYIIPTYKVIKLPTKMNDTKELWKSALSEIEANLSKPNFNTWFKDAYISRQDGGTVYLSLPNQFVRDWVASKYHTLLLRIFRNISENIRSVEYSISKDRSDGVTRAQEVTPLQQIGGSLPLQDYYVDVVMEIVNNYDVDGFNMDHIRYRDQYMGYNPISLGYFHQFTGRSDRPAIDDPEWSAWRREQITNLVKRVYANILKVKPHVLLTIDGKCIGEALEDAEDNAFWWRVF